MKKRKISLHYEEGYKQLSESDIKKIITKQKFHESKARVISVDTECNDGKELDIFVWGDFLIMVDADNCLIVYKYEQSYTIKDKKK